MAKAFFCDHCGTRVDAGADSCPSCGRPFLAVRCPSCGHRGSARDFDKGCPLCGYLSDGYAGGRDDRYLPPASGHPRSRKKFFRFNISAPLAWTLIAVLLGALAGLVWLYLNL